MALFGFGKLVVKSALRKPATRLYPFEKRASMPATRGHIEFAAEGCIYCSICAKKCPTGAIAVNRKAKSWQIDSRKCIVCSACVDKCPKSSLSMANTPMPPLTSTQWQDLEEQLIAEPAPAPAQVPVAACAAVVSMPEPAVVS